jgi:hypothetical protein
MDSLKTLSDASQQLAAERKHVASDVQKLDAALRVYKEKVEDSILQAYQRGQEASRAEVAKLKLEVARLKQRLLEKHQDADDD